MGKKNHSAHATDFEKESEKNKDLKDREMTEKELEEVTGGVYQIKTCKHCHRVAVAGMDVCAVCFRQYYQDGHL